jgi:hypothetical protein
MQLAHFLGIRLHHSLAHRNLAITSDDDFAIFANGHNGGSVPDRRGMCIVIIHSPDMGLRR